MIWFGGRIYLKSRMNARATTHHTEKRVQNPMIKSFKTKKIKIGVSVDYVRAMKMNKTQLKVIGDM